LEDLRILETCVEDHALFLTDKGAIYGIGRNNVGQVIGSRVVSRERDMILIPLMVSSIPSMRSVSCGEPELEEEPLLYSWGIGTYGERGLGLDLYTNPCELLRKLHIYQEEQGRLLILASVLNLHRLLYSGNASVSSK